MTMRHLFRSLVHTFAAACCVALASGCAPSRRAPQIDTYAIVLPAAPVAEPTANARTFVIRSFTASPLAASQQLLYRTDEFKFERSFSQRFLADPAANVEALLLHQLTTRPGLEALSPADAEKADFVVDGLMHELYVDVRDSSAPQTVVSLSVRIQGSDGRLIDTRSWRVPVGIADRSASTAMGGFASGLKTIADDFGARLESMDKGR